MKSVMQHDFSKVPGADIPRSSFNRSHGLKTTFDAGFLVPVFVDEVLPGDTFNCRMTVFARLATPLVPFMDNMFLDSFFFFVPNRLVWNNWEKFMGQQDNPGDSTDYLVPRMAAPPVGGFPNSTLFDYFGIPTQVDNLLVSALPFRAYNLIWNTWFRDENLQNSLVVDKGDGPDTTAVALLQPRGKRFDYFTSALPWPQKGPSARIPLQDGIPVVGNDKNILFTGAGAFGMTNLRNAIANGTNASVDYSGGTWPGVAALAFGGPTTTGWDPSYTFLEANASQYGGTINQLRQAFQMQKLYERDARGGTRYTEIIRSHFGVVSPDARLQRPEYLGGGSSPITLHPVAQTSEAGTTPQANLSAFATVNASGHGFSKAFTEHGIIIGLVAARADLNYQQGLNRMWSRRTKYDFYWPALSNLGEQAILNKEIYAQGNATDELVFGYQECYAEYRYFPSIITGQFRSNYAQSLDYWHLAQDFASLPGLNAAFIRDNPPIDRVIANPAEPHFLFDSYFNLITARPMPTYAVPGLVDHF